MVLKWARRWVVRHPNNSLSRLSISGDRVLVGAVLFMAAVLAWAYTVWSAAAMSGMGGIGAMNMRLGVSTAGPSLGLVAFLPMWTVMMAAMMFPSAEPMFSIFGRVQQRRVEQGRAYVPIWLFGAGYLGVWALLGAPALFLNVGLEAAAERWSTLRAVAPYVGGVILVGAGLYQLTPWKDACLSHCRSPLHFIMMHWQEGRFGALRMGARHGWYCIGCCWALMAVLFVVGVMNLAWMGILALAIFLERVGPWDRPVVHATAVVLCVAGVLMLINPALVPGF